MRPLTDNIYYIALFVTTCVFLFFDGSNLIDAVLIFLHLTHWAGQIKLRIICRLTIKDISFYSNMS